MNKFLYTLLLFCTAYCCSAQTLWTGDVSADWHDAGNWTQGVPTTGQTATIPGAAQGGVFPTISQVLIIDFTIQSFGGSITFMADAFNNGSVVNSSGGVMTLSNGATFTNSGTVTFLNDGVFENDGTFINYGTFNQNGNGIFNNNPQGSFINFGTIGNIGNYNNDGTLENRGNLTNSSQFTNNGVTRNYGFFSNTFVSTFTNSTSGTFVNETGAQLFIDNVFNNNGQITDSGSTSVNGQGMINNNGTMDLSGLYTVGTMFNNDGTVNNSGNFRVNFGTLNNNSVWNNTGTLNNTGRLNNNSGANLNNTANLSVASCSRLFQYSSNVIDAVTNDGVVYEVSGIVNTNASSQGQELTNENENPLPFVECKDINIQLDATGNVDITPGDLIVDADAKYCNIVTVAADQTSFSCSDLGPNTVEFSITDGFGGVSTCNSIVTIIERSPNPCNTSFLNYCASTATNNSSEFIQSVSITTLDNNSGDDDGYADYTDLVSELDFGNFYDLTLTPGFPSSSRLVYWKVWIDWNIDGDFDDAGELVVDESSNSQITGSVNVPGTAVPGTTRMRVSMKRFLPLESCQTFTNGEVEDYTIKINSDIIIQRCPVNQVVSAQPGATTAPAGWIPARGFSTCPNSTEIELIEGLPNGSQFPLGVTTNTLQFSDGCDGVETCSFTITVNPTPVNFSLDCPSDIILMGNANLGGAIANWIPPFPAATCPQGLNFPTQISGPSFGDFLPMGSSTQICYETSDNCGNVDNCCFFLFVQDPNNSLSIDNCPASDIVLDAQPGATGATVTYANLTTTSDCATGGITLDILDGLPSGSIFPIGTTQVVYRAFDDCNSADLCEFNVTVNSTASTISINCPDDVVLSAEPGAFSQVVSWAAVTASSDCASGAVSVAQTEGLPNGSAFPVGNTVIIYTISDGCGNAEICTFNVTINVSAATLDLTCPADIDVDAGPGEVGTIVTWTDPAISTDCFNGGAEAILVSPLVSGSIFPLGSKEVIYFGSDDCGNTTSCSFFVNVNPVSADLNITCPNDIVQTVNINQNSATATWSAPTTSTTCSGNVATTQIAGVASGSSFDAGVTTITYSASDDCGNVEICSFTVTVDVNVPADNAEIDLTCLDDITVTAATGASFASVGFDVPTATTTCNTGGGGSSICANRTVSQTNSCSSNVADYAMWLNFSGLHNRYTMANGQFTEFTDGTATLTGVITNVNDSNIRFQVNSQFSGRTTIAPPDSPKSHSCLSPNVSNFYYYQSNTGTLTGQGSAAGAILQVQNVGEAFQLGNGGNVTHDGLDFGASGWLSINIVQQPSGNLNLVLGSSSPNNADYNLVLSGTDATCNDNGTAGCSGPDNISGFTLLGEFEDSKYYVYNSATSWTTAKSICAQNGGHLATISSQVENDFIQNNTNPASGSVWIGYNAIGTTTFSWDNGEPNSYENWQVGEPNETTNDVAARLRKDSGKWTDRQLTNSFEFVMEIPCGGVGCNRVTDDLQVLYDFREGSGNTITDVSGVGSPLNLTIANPNNVNWISGGCGLSVNASTIAKTNGAASKIISAVKSSHEITMEAWVKPANTTQGGPSRISTISASTTLRNTTLGQEGVEYAARLRTSSTTNNGIPTISGGNVSTSLQHVVYTRNAAGVEKMYVNGAEVYSGTRTGNVNNWDNDYQFALFNELTNNRTWLGEMYLSAVYSKALSAAEVMQNYNAGECCGGSSEATVTQIAGNAPNTNFPVGTTTVIYEATDACGNTDYCSFDVTVLAPATNLSLNDCPTDITVQTAAGEDFAAVTWTAPTATSDCATGDVVVSQIAGFASGSAFPTGVTTVTYRAVDGCGNEQLCSFFVTVESTPAPPTEITVDCVENFTIQTLAGDNSAVAAWTEPTGTTTCADSDVEVSQIGGLPNGGNFPIGTTVIFYRLEDDCGNVQSCAFNVTVEAVGSSIDIVCPSNVSVNADPDADYGVATFATATATSTCYTGSPSVAQISGLPSGSLFPVGNSLVFFRATDDCGNVDVCNFVVTVNATPITNIDPCINDGGDSDNDGVCDDNDICAGSDDNVDTDGDGTPDGCDACPNDASGDSDGDGVCDSEDICPDSDDNADLDGDGIPNGCDICPVDVNDDSDGDGICDFEDICPGSDDLADADGDGIPDGCDDLNCACEADGDINAPTLQGVPADMTVECDNIPTAPNVVSIDDCTVNPTVSDSEVITQGICANSFTIERTWTATDVCGNTAVATQTITVQDTQAPVFSDVPVDVTVDANSIPTSNPMVSDKCDTNVSLEITDTQSYPNPDCQDFYEIERIWTATDACGNSVQAVQIITVLDDSNLLDDDNDGVCNADDICAGFDDNMDTDGDGTPDGCDTVNCIPGDACDDGDANTENDIFDENCGCAGTPIACDDDDNDGVCNADDQCEGFDDSIDNDNDGIIDGCDPCQTGATCDDGDANTENDVFDANCGCAGTPISGEPDCDNITITAGANSIIVTNLGGAPISSLQIFNSVYQTEFSCFADCSDTETLTVTPGTYYVYAKYYEANYQLICENVQTIIVTDAPCDDDDNDGVCNDIDQCEGFDDSIDMDNDGIVDGCDPCQTGATCDDGDANTINDVFDANCNCAGEIDLCDGTGDSDGDGVCDAIDECPGFDDSIDNDNDGIVDGCDPCQTGATCDDGDANTENDVFDENCNCAGTAIPVGPDCDNITITAGANSIIVTNLGGAPISSLQIFNSVYQTEFSCFADCSDTETLAVTPGTYYVYAKYYEANYQLICENVQTIIVTDAPCDDDDNDGVCNDIDQCEGFDDSIDMDNDGIVDGCDPCQTGAACDDGDANTENDVYDANCGCAGTPIGCDDDDNDGVCNDDDQCEGFDDSIDMDNDGIVDGCDPCQTGATCDDGDANTENDVYDANCGCAGTPINGGGDPDCDDISITVDNGNIIVTNLNGAPVSSLQILNSSYQNEFTCFANCSDTETIAVTPGTYFVYAKYYTGAYQQICQNVQTVTVTNGGGGCTDADGDGYCAADDCDDNNPNLPAAVGTSCNDGNPNTTGDQIQADGCTCEGTPANPGDPNCADISIATDAGNIVVSGLDGAPISSLQIFNSVYQTEFSCFADCSATESIPVSAGVYYVYAKYYTAQYQLICEVVETIDVSANLVAVNSNMDFQAKQGPLVANLHWSVSQDVNVSHYEVETSADGVHFENLSTVLAEQSETPELYRLEDDSPEFGVNYYRVQTVYFDGNKATSKTRRLNFDVDFGDILIFPNPATETVKLSVKDFAGQAGKVVIYDLLGKPVYQQDFLSLPSIPMDINLTDYRSGVYHITVAVDGYRLITKKLVVQD